MDIRDRRISKMPDISSYRDENKLFVTAADIIKRLLEKIPVSPELRLLAAI
jgi:hypothetical protein